MTIGFKTGISAILIFHTDREHEMTLWRYDVKTLEGLDPATCLKLQQRLKRFLVHAAVQRPAAAMAVTPTGTIRP
jgi:hypothetical protein